tara:strand:- start:19250 stop:20326 length:1077 start_codon:yes stop_codon:yes gene_type:complete
MIENSDFINWPPYGLAKEEKSKLITNKLKDLTSHHFVNCKEYQNLILRRNIDIEKINSIHEMPMIPVRLFKHYELRSISPSNVYKTMYSSGTSGQARSKIILDKNTSQYQTKALVKILQNFIGNKRLPMLIIDNPGVLKDRNNYSARGAGILGLSNFGHSHTYALNDDMTLNIESIKEFCKTFSDKPKLLFGFTFMIWKYFILSLEKECIHLNLENSILIHSGGWKKLQSDSVSNDIFKKKIINRTSIKDIHDFYGMVEQVGSIFVECKSGYLHAPSFADIIIRDPITYDLLPYKKEGIVQVLSCLPHSYPGHSILTEDMGTIYGEDDCTCGMKGKYFKISGRIPNSENRGCSNTHSL